MTFEALKSRFLEFSSLAYCRVCDIKFFGNFNTNLFISSLSFWWSKIVVFWNSKTSTMLNRWQFLCVLTPPSAAAESSKEVKLRKTYGRPILSCGGGTRIHNFPLPGDFPYSIILWGRGKHDPSRHLSPDRRTRMGRRKISSMPLNTLMCGEIGRISRVGSFVELEVLSTKMMSSFDSCQVLLPPPICIWTIAWDTKISLTMRANLRDNGKF